MSKNILVTGGAGFIGSCFIRTALDAGDKVIVLDALTYAGHEENLEQVSDNPNFHMIIGNICNRELISKILQKHNICSVINFAAESHVDNSINSPGEFINTNITGVYELLESSRAYFNNLTDKDKFKFIQISTDEVYGSLELDEDRKFKETDKMDPSSPYSASKAAAEHLARAWHKTYGLPVIITNCTNNYGPRQFPEKLIPHMIKCALTGKDLPVYGDGKNIRDWIHVEDHCQGIYLALTKGEIGETYLFGGRAEVANIDIVNNICQLLDEIRPGEKSYKEQITFVKDRPGHDRRYAIDDSLSENKLGFTRKYNFEQGLKDTIIWYLENEEWSRRVTKCQQKG